MPYPDEPTTLTDWIDEVDPPVATEVVVEEASTSYSIGHVPHTNIELYPISVIGDAAGALTPSFTDQSPASGHIYINPLNGNVIQSAADVPDRVTFNFYSRGTANNEANLEAVNGVVVEAYQAALFGWVEETTTPSESITAKKGNYEVDGKCVQFEGGTLDLSAYSFTNPGYTVQMRIVVTTAGELRYKAGSEGVDADACEDLEPPAYPGSTTIARVFKTDGTVVSSANILNVRAVVSGSGSEDPDEDDEQKFTYDVGVVSGAGVVINGNKNVGLASNDDDDKVPCRGFVVSILDDTYCKVRFPGQTIDFTGKSKGLTDMTAGSYYYLSTNGSIKSSQHKVVDEWDQMIGVAIDASTLQIICGPATKNEPGGVDPDDSDGPGPEGRTFKRAAGIAVAEFVRLTSDLETVDEAKADSSTTMPAIGIVTELVGDDYCIVKNNYMWITSDHGDALPAGCSVGNAGDIWYISVNTEGEAMSSKSIVTGHVVQVACRQVDAAGTQWLICCGAFETPEPFDVDQGFDCDCDSEVDVGNAVYLDSSAEAHNAIANDTFEKANVAGIVKAVNGDNTRCTIVRPPNVYDPESTYATGEYFLSNTTAGEWGSDVLHKPGCWKVRIGWGRGSNQGGLLLDTYIYPMDDVDPDDVDPDRRAADYWSYSLLTVGRAVECDVVRDVVRHASDQTCSELKGICLECTENPDYPESGAQYIARVQETGLYDTGSAFANENPIFVIGTSGLYQQAMQIGALYKKQVGVPALDSNGDRKLIDIRCGSWSHIEGVNPDTLEPIPIDTVNTNSPLGTDPVPINVQVIMLNDGTDSGAKASTDWTSGIQALPGPARILGMDVWAASTGVGSGAYLEFDLTTGSGATLLSTKGQITAQGSGVAGDTLPSSPNSSNHQRPVIDSSCCYLTPGQTFGADYTRNGVFSEDPYGIFVRIIADLIKGWAAL